MLPLDKWAVTRLNALIDKVFAAYDNYEFHVVSHADQRLLRGGALSSFYFDIIKDRLYCDEADGPGAPQRPDRAVPDPGRHDPACSPPSWPSPATRSGWPCPTAPATMPATSCSTRWCSPTPATPWTEEAMAHVGRASPPSAPPSTARWSTARADKTIGKSLEAEVDLTVTAEDAFLADMDAADLADTLIVSQVRVDVGAEQTVAVRPAAGAKCLRCWKVLPTVGSDAEHPDLCPRCAAVVKDLPGHRVSSLHAKGRTRFACPPFFVYALFSSFRSCS